VDDGRWRLCDQLYEAVTTLLRFLLDAAERCSCCGGGCGQTVLVMHRGTLQSVQLTTVFTAAGIMLTGIITKACQLCCRVSAAVALRWRGER
jgi:hypothetical protein